MKSIEERLWENVDRSGGPDACWKWIGHENVGGYGRLSFHGRKVLAHRLVCELSKGAFDNELCVCHRCDSPSCCNPAHLFIGTHQENMSDRNKKGRQSKGERHSAKMTEVACRGDAHFARRHPERMRRTGEQNGRAKLNPCDIKKIFELKSEGISNVKISDALGVSDTLVGLILRGKAWAHLVPEMPT